MFCHEPRGLIYMGTVLPTGKSYIGLTTDFENRRYAHFHGRSEFAMDIRRFGVDNVVWRILEDDVPYDDLPHRERYWISFYGTYHFGYNSSLGGEIGGRRTGSQGMGLDVSPSSWIRDVYRREWIQVNLRLNLNYLLKKSDTRTLKEAHQKFSKMCAGILDSQLCGEELSQFSFHHTNPKGAHSIEGEIATYRMHLSSVDYSPLWIGFSPSELFYCVDYQESYERTFVNDKGFDKDSPIDELMVWDFLSLQKFIVLVSANLKRVSGSLRTPVFYGDTRWLEDTTRVLRRNYGWWL